MNLPDHVPTDDNRFGQLTAVWTYQLSDKTVLNTRLSSLGFNNLSSIGRREPWEYDTQSPNYWNGNTALGT